MPPRRGNAESNSVRDQLKDVFNAVSAPNPLETLGLTPEAVQRLTGDSLDMAVKGLYRAYQRTYHPDAQGGDNLSEDPRLKPIQTAYDSYGEDPAAVRENYLKQARQKRSKQPTGTTGLNSGSRASRQIAQTSNGEWLNKLNYQIYEPSILRVQEANLLLRPESMIEDQKMPPESLRIDDLDIYSTAYRYSDSVFPLPENLADILHTRIHKPIGIFVNKGKVNIEEKYLLQGSKPEDIELEDGWYEVRGTIDDSGQDKRSLQVYSSSGKERQLEGIRLVGSFSYEIWKHIRDDYRKAANSDDIALSAGELPEMPASPSMYRNTHQRIALNAVQKLVKSEAFDERLRPRIVNSDMLMATNGGHEFYALGRIAHQHTKYFGKNNEWFWD